MSTSRPFNIDDIYTASTQYHIRPPSTHQQNANFRWRADSDPLLDVYLVVYFFQKDYSLLWEIG